MPPTSVAALAPTEPAAPTVAPEPSPAPESPVGPAPAVPEAAPAAPEPEPAATPEPEPAAAPAYAALKLPEGISARPEIMAEATKLFGEMKLPEGDAQKLVDLHGTILKNAIEGYQSTASDFWNNRAKEWVAEAKADPQIGGNRFDTSIKRARAVWNEVLPTEADRTRLFGDLTDTKMGDHPVLAKALSEVGRRFEQVLTATGTTTWADAMKKLREPGAPPPGTPARAPGTNGRAADRRYTRNQGA